MKQKKTIGKNKRILCVLSVLLMLLSMVLVTVSAETPTHTHTYTDWQYNFGQHYKNCTDCDEIFFLEGHKGGNATCEENGKCSVCGYAYIEASEDYHVPDTSKWLVRAGMYHFHACTICGAHCDIEDHRWSPTVLSAGAKGHAYKCADCGAWDTIVAHEAGPTGTPNTDVVCKDCGYVITPAKTHEHKLTKVTKKEATCVEAGYEEHYTCSGCKDVFSDSKGTKKITKTEIAPLGHTASDVWGTDDQLHWRVCTTCNQVMIETQMVHELEDGICTTCGFEAAKAEDTTPVPTETEPTAAPLEQEGNKAKTPWWIPVLIGVCVVGMAVFTAMVVVIVILVIKLKKTKK